MHILHFHPKYQPRSRRSERKIIPRNRRKFDYPFAIDYRRYTSPFTEKRNLYQYNAIAKLTHVTVGLETKYMIYPYKPTLVEKADPVDTMQSNTILTQLERRELYRAN